MQDSLNVENTPAYHHREQKRQHHSVYIYIYIYIYISRNYCDILAKTFKYIIPFFSCDISQSSFEILNQNFVDIPHPKWIEKKH